MKRLSLALCTLVLAGLPSTAALASPINFDFSFTSSSDGIFGSGVFTAIADGTNTFLIESATGTTNTSSKNDQAISELLTPGSFTGNDNLLSFSPSTDTYSLDYMGVAYGLQNGADINLFNLSGNSVLLQRVGGAWIENPADITITEAASTSPVPEPNSLVLLSTALVAAGMITVFRRKFAV